MFHTPHLKTPTPRPMQETSVRFNGTETLLKRLASQESTRIRDRLKSIGVNPNLLNEFETDATGVLTRAILVDPKKLQDDISAIAKRMSRTALFGKTRVGIEDQVTSMMRVAAARVHDSSKPVEPHNPFMVVAVVEKDRTPEFA